MGVLYDKGIGMNATLARVAGGEEVVQLQENRSTPGIWLLYCCCLLFKYTLRTVLYTYKLTERAESGEAFSIILHDVFSSFPWYFFESSLAFSDCQLI